MEFASCTQSSLDWYKAGLRIYDSRILRLHCEIEHSNIFIVTLCVNSTCEHAMYKNWIMYEALTSYTENWNKIKRIKVCVVDIYFLSNIRSLSYLTTYARQERISIINDL